MQRKWGHLYRTGVDDATVSPTKTTVAVVSLGRLSGRNSERMVRRKSALELPAACVMMKSTQQQT